MRHDAGMLHVGKNNVGLRKRPARWRYFLHEAGGIGEAANAGLNEDA